MAIDTNEILRLLSKSNPALDAPVIKIEFQGVVDNLEVKSMYLVPASEEYPFALHIEVQYAAKEEIDPQLQQLLDEEPTKKELQGF